MLHIAGGIILAVLFLRALPELLLATRQLFRGLFIIIVWLSVIYAGCALFVSLPFIIENVFVGPDPWFWLSLAAIGTIIIVRRALRTPVDHKLRGVS